MTLDLRAVDERITAALADGIGSAAALDVGDAGQPVAQRVWGRCARVPTPGEPVTPHTRWDVASLTKVVVTTALAMRLHARGALDLDAPVARHLPELDPADPGKAAITARHLLAHSAGLHWWIPFYQRPAAPAPYAALVRAAAAEPLDAPPGTRVVYSDLGFILLGALLERLAGARLDALAARDVFTPLAMTASQFVDLAAPARPSPVVATEHDARRGGIVSGEVHDENAHAAGGIAGHAGLFSTAADLGRFAAALARSWRGERFPGGFDPATVREFCRPATAIPGATRCLGWDSPSPEPGASQAGDLWPRADAVGHMGFTGASLWLDLPRARWVALLTNRVHPSRTDERIKQVRPRVHDDLVRALDARAAA